MKSGELKWYGFFSVAFGTFMSTLDFSAVTVALPKIARDFNAAITDVEWVSLAYTLTIGSLLLPLGKCGDHFGKHRLFKMGFGAFIASSALCALSPTVFSLILWRVFQGMGGAIYMSVGSAILVDSFPSSQRGKALGFIGLVVSLGLMLGPLVGGFLTHYFSWRAIFLINVPIGFFGLVWTYLFLPRDVREEKRFRFDFEGAFLSIVALSSLLCILTRISVWGINSYYIWGLFLIFIVSGTLFFFVERKNPYGVLDFSLFKNKFFAFGNFSLLLHSVSLHIAYFLIPFFLAEAVHFSQRKIGLVMTAIPAAFALINPISGWFSDKVGTRILVPMGLFMSGLAYIKIGQLTEISNMTELVIAFLFLGITTGIFQAPNASAIMGAVDRAQLGTASALISTMRNCGSVIGVAMATMMFSFRVQAYNGFSSEFLVHQLPSDLFTKAFRDTLWSGALIVMIAAGFSLLRGSDSKIG